MSEQLNQRGEASATEEIVNDGTHRFQGLSDEEKQEEGSSSTSDEFLVGWDDNDPLNPRSFKFYGRRPIYLTSMFFFLMFGIPCATAHNIQTMLVGRFLVGLSGSAFLSVAAGTVSDFFVGHAIQAPMMLSTVSIFLGPVIGPVVGGFINQFTSWRWTFYLLLIWTGVIFVCLIFVPETYHPILLAHKAAALRKSTNNPAYRSASEIALASKSLPRRIMVGTVVGVLSNPLWAKNYQRLVARAKAAHGEENKQSKPDPELRLPPAIFGSILVPIGIFWFGWTTYSSVHWIVPIIGSILFGAGNILCFSGIWTFLVDAYPIYAASAMAANTCTRCIFAAAFPLFGDQMYKKLGYQWASSLLAFLALGMTPFIYLFYKYGKVLRLKSKFSWA
ncbi:hypothetical protein B7463_g9593, partial [Scytalidium lignicola]